MRLLGEAEELRFPWWCFWEDLRDAELSTLCFLEADGGRELERWRWWSPPLDEECLDSVAFRLSLFLSRRDDSDIIARQGQSKKDKRITLQADGVVG